MLVAYTYYNNITIIASLLALLLISFIFNPCETN